MATPRTSPGSGSSARWPLFVHFGKATGDPGCDARADANGDGVINAPDLQMVVAHFGTSVP